MQSLNMIADDPCNYPFLKRKSPSALQWLMIYLSSPFTWPGALKHYMSRKPDRNCIKKSGTYMSGNINSSLSPEISVKKMKEQAKLRGVTVNDLMLGITSKALKKYFKLHNDDSKEISLTLPFSFKTIPESPDDYTYGNKFVSLTVYLKLKESLDEACKMAKNMMNTLKNSSQPGAFFTLLEFYGTFMPIQFCNRVSQTSGVKHSVLLSNLLAHVNQVKYLGGNAKRFYYSGSGTGNISTGIVIVSMVKRA